MTFGKIRRDHEDGGEKNLEMPKWQVKYSFYTKMLNGRRFDGGFMSKEIQIEVVTDAFGVSL